jgi:hypothetical protein
VSYGSQHQERTAANEEPVSDIRRITVLRCNALGDYLMTTPALTALRDTCPHAEITLLAGDWHADFLSGRPSPVDRVLVVPDVAGLAGQPSGAPPQDTLRDSSPTRSYRYDLAVQLHGGGAASNPLAGRPLVDRAARRERCTAGRNRALPLLPERSLPIPRSGRASRRPSTSGVPRAGGTAREHAVAAELLPGDGP